MQDDEIGMEDEAGKVLKDTKDAPEEVLSCPTWL